MLKLKISETYSTIIDAADEPLVAGRCLKVVGDEAKGHYVYVFDQGKMVALSRLILGAPDGLLVDHINHDTFDNRRANLRLATSTENNRNRRKKKSPSTSMYKGVTRMRGGWRSCITVDGVDIKLGRFATEIEAAQRYDIAATRHFGEFALLNGVDSRVVPARLDRPGRRCRWVEPNDDWLDL